MTQELNTPEAICLMVNTFYDRVQADAVLAPMFAGVDWPHHLPKMYAFWQGLLLGQAGYHGNPMQAHLQVHHTKPFIGLHFQRWLALFRAVIADLFHGDHAQRALAHAERIACVIQSKIRQVDGRGL